MPKRLMNRKVPIPRARKLFFADSANEDIGISIAKTNAYMCAPDKPSSARSLSCGPLSVWVSIVE
jgi:hypothetical protein